MAFIDEEEVRDAVKTPLGDPGATLRDTDRVFVVLTDETGEPTGQIVQYAISVVRLGLLLPVLYLTAAPIDPGLEGQEARVTHDGVVDIYVYEKKAWVPKINGIVLKGAASMLPKPKANTFADFQDTQTGGSVRIVPAAGYVAADYRYAVGAGSPYQAAPADGIITVGNVTAAVFTYLPGDATRQQSDTAVSGTFQEYKTSTPGNTTPNKPTFSNFNDKGKTVILVPDGNIPLSDYRYKVGGSGVEAVAPADGIINVGNVTAQVYAYSVAVPGRNQSLTAASPSFTATTPATVPGAPTITKATPGDNLAHIEWAAPASTGGSDITGYEVFIANTTTLLGTTDGNERYYDDNSAVNGTPRSYQVRAVNAVGPGQRSPASAAVTPVSGTTPPPTAKVPSAPLEVLAQLVNNKPTISWAAPSSDGGATITGYEVYRSGSTGKVGTTAGLTFTDSAAPAGTFTYTVKAVNTVGTGPGGDSNQITVVATPRVFQLALNPGENDGPLTGWNALANTKFLYDAGFVEDTGPQPAAMLVYFQTADPANQIGQLNYYGGDDGKVCGIYYAGKQYEKDINGNLCTLRNSDPTTGKNLLIIG